MSSLGRWHKLHPSEGTCILQKLAALGLDPKQFGLHSLRSGGASAAANAAVCSNTMAVGIVKMQRMVALKTLWKAGCLCHGILACELNSSLYKLLISLFHFLWSLTLHMGG